MLKPANSIERRREVVTFEAARVASTVYGHCDIDRLRGKGWKKVEAASVSSGRWGPWA